MCDELRCRNEDLQKGGLDQYQKMKLEKFIKGLKISYAMPNPGGQVQKRIYKVTGLGDTPIREKFDIIIIYYYVLVLCLLICYHFKSDTSF